jgi:hypothetical protein
MCRLSSWEQTAIISLYSINWLVFITETDYVYCAVRTGYLNIIRAISFKWISEQTTIISLYNINWLVFITETECVYCAVRTGSVNVIQVNQSIEFFVLRPCGPSVSRTVDISQSLSRRPVAVIRWPITHSGCAEAAQQWSLPALTTGIRTFDARRWPPASAEFKEWVQLYLCCPFVPSWCGQGDTCL